MKLLYCIPSLYNPGGMERILTEKINTLVEVYKYDVYVVTTDQLNKPLFFNISDKVKFIHLDINFNESYNYSLYRKIVVVKKKNDLYKIKLENILKKYFIDICISTGGKELEFLSKIKAPCKKVLEYHFAKSFRKQFLLARKNNLLNKLIGEIRVRQLILQTKKLDRVVVLTKNDEIQWLKTNNNIKQIYNFCPKKNDNISSLQSNNAIAIGRLDAQKGFDLLIDAWNINKEQLSSWKLNIFGQGEWFDLLSNKIKDYKLEKNIILRGVTDNVENELLDSSVFLFSSRYEGFGLVLLEAMQKGIPSVSFNCPEGPSELLQNNSGFLIPMFDLNKFADYIVKLTSDVNLRLEMGRNAVLQSEEFSKENIMKKWDEFFKELL